MQQLISSAEFAKLARVNPSTVTRIRKTVLQRAIVGKRIDAGHPDAVAYLNKRDEEMTPPTDLGIDPLYEEAVKWCRDNNRFSITGLQREFRIGYSRARKLVQMMNLGGLVPAKIASPVEPAEIAPPEQRTQRTYVGTRPRKKDAAPPPRNEDDVIEIPEDIEHLANFTVREIFEKFGTESRFIDFLNAIKNIEAINEKRLKNAATKGTLINRRLVEVGVIGVFNSAHLRLLKDGAKSIAAGVISKHAAGGELSEVEAYVTDILGSFIKPVKSKIERSLKEA